MWPQGPSFLGVGVAGQKCRALRGQGHKRWVVQRLGWEGGRPRHHVQALRTAPGTGRGLGGVGDTELLSGSGSHSRPRQLWVGAHPEAGGTMIGARNYRFNLGLILVTNLIGLSEA